jgi:nicotinamide phosphoribosyltransferase
VECTNATNNEDGTPNDEVYFKEILEKFPTGYISIVADGYDYWHFLTTIVPKYRKEILARDGRVVIRPDSGDPVKIICGDPTAENQFVRMGSYEFLWNIFGGHYNELGYKELDSHIGLLYGDSINIKRQRVIYEQMENKFFALTNLVLGIGSFSYSLLSRDCLALACKATFCIVNGKSIEIYKDPKTVTGTPKKSHRGLIRVVTDEDGKYHVIDRCTLEEEENDNELKTVFEDGKLVREFTFEEIRQTRRKAVLESLAAQLPHD